MFCARGEAYAGGRTPLLTTLRQLSDYRGQTLVSAVMATVRRARPIHVSIVGGEPLVRYRELCEILPQLGRMGIEVQVATSAVRPIPDEWRDIGSLHLVVLIDGLPPEHDKRRAPAIYDRILKHIARHRVIVHWSARPEARRIWFSVYTPQQGDDSPERLRPQDREFLWGELSSVAARFPKVHLPRVVLKAYRNPPTSPVECTFAKVTTCVSADLATPVTPCQFGGKPVCTECGCMASAGLHGLASVKLGGIVPLSAILNASMRASGLIPRPATLEPEIA